jgi:O-antigen/teichoic acid export membrane protein
MTPRYGAERVRRGIGHFILGKGISATGGFLAMVLVVRLLSVDAFADYSVFVALVEVFTAFSGLGLAHALLRYVPELYAKHYRIALREFVLGAFALRTGVLLLAIGAVYLLASPVAGFLGAGDSYQAMRLFLLVVLFRTSSHFLSQILESTLHQGVTQMAFSVASVSRLLGMVYLMMTGTATLTSVIWAEVISELLCVILMLRGIVNVVVEGAAEAPRPDDDSQWLRRNLRQIARFSVQGYTQHVVGLPFGGNTNRMVGGHMFAPSAMANYGFAQSLYEYTKRYLPAQLLIGLIRPIVVARFSEKRNFSAAAGTCERIILVNMLFIGMIFSALLVGGDAALSWVSGGKYGTEALIILVGLLVVLTLETHRLILELLVQTVERYSILIRPNLFLALSVLPAIYLYRYIGIIAFPASNAVALAFSNLWVKRQLLKESYVYRAQHGTTLQICAMVLAGALLGNALYHAGLPWYVAMAVSELVFLLSAWKFHWQDLKSLAADLMGRKTLPVQS